MKTLAFLQNQWFADPEKVREILKRRPEARQRIITYSLFAGCETGRVLKATLGEEWCRKIVWEEASCEIGGKASAVFPADTRHILDTIVRVQPHIIIALGKIAADAIQSLGLIYGDGRIIAVIAGPHPTARNLDVGAKLRRIRTELDKLQAAA